MASLKAGDKFTIDCTVVNPDFDNTLISVQYGNGLFTYVMNKCASEQHGYNVVRAPVPLAAGQKWQRGDDVIRVVKYVDSVMVAYMSNDIPYAIGRLRFEQIKGVLID